MRYFLSVLLLIPTLWSRADLPARTTLARAVLERYGSFTTEEKQAALAGLAGRPDTAALVLDALAEGRIPRSDLPGLVARQIALLGDAALTAKLEKAWGRIGSSAPGAEEAAKEHARWKGILTPEFLRKGSAPQGRVLFRSICATCHTMFGEGAKIGPDLTGSNRADLDYLLENITQPSAVLGRDYELHVFTLTDGRAAAGIVRKETDSAFTVQTLTSEEVVAKNLIKTHDQPGISMMPANLLSALNNEQARDLMAYLASPSQVPMPGEAGASDIFQVPGALEGESLRIIAKKGNPHPQDMRMWKDGRWSGDKQLWWTGAATGDQLTLALPVSSPGKYSIEAVLTRAPDYGVVKFLLDGEPLAGKQIDLFGSRVTNTPQIKLGERQLTAGEHRLTVEITGANPEAVKSYMFGLDYLWLQRM